MGGGPSKNDGIAPYSIVPHYGSINFTDDGVPAETLQIGASIGGRVSPVRRFFALLTTFDVLFSFFLWVMCAMLKHKNVRDVFRCDVLSYSIDSSLFDLVVVAGLRFVIILITYIFFRVKHWTLIALTTALSGAFSITKTFLYDWTGQDTPSVILLVSSFVLPWAEAWFLDFRVVPSENKASQLLARIVNDAFPVIPSVSHALSEGGATSFYSPEVSDNESNCGDTVPRWSDSLQNKLICSDDSEIKPLSPEARAYKKKADEAMDISLKIFHQSNWKTEKMIEDDAIQSCHTIAYGKVYKYAGFLPASSETVLHLLFEKCDEQKSWNPTIKEVRVIEKIDPQTDIIYVISEGASGVVSCRDFVNLRTWQRRGESYLLSVISTEHPDAPNQGNFVRAEQGPMLYMIAPSDTNPLHCKFQWLMNVNLKGWIPQYLIDKAMTKKMWECVGALKTHLLDLPSNEINLDMYE